MSDTALYVSLAANAFLALPTLAKAYKRRVESDSEMLSGMMAQVNRLTARCEDYERRIDGLEAQNLELERAKEEATMLAKQLAASEARARALYDELYDMFCAVTGTHQGVSVPPPRWEKLDK
jgi:predicted RNase H-like nuclease (RuvC/YqgF family)